MDVSESSTDGGSGRRPDTVEGLTRLEIPTANQIDGDPPVDSDGEDAHLYDDQDDARSFIQPAISPMATRLTSPRTPAIEKAMAMDAGASMFDSFMARFSAAPGQSSQQQAVSPSQRKVSRLRERPMSLVGLPSSPPGNYTLPSPWQAGPKEMVIQEPEEPGLRHQISISSNQSRHRRSSSVGAEALKRLSKALPSLSDLLPSISTPSLFSSGSSHKAESPTTSASHSAQLALTQPRRSQQHPLRSVEPAVTTQKSHAHTFPVSSPGDASQSSETPTAGLRPSTSAQPGRPPLLWKTTSDESLLYHSISRVSSLTDDDHRWDHVRDMGNPRLQAILDSWERPNFKLERPSFKIPNIMPASRKRAPAGSSETLAQTQILPSPADPSRESLAGFDAILPYLTGDIVIMGGYRGSVLRSAEPPHRQLWVPVKVGLNIRKVNLEVGLDSEDEETMESRIFASGMLKNIGPVDVSRRLFKKLRDSENARTGKLRVHDYGYDWRLSPHLLSRKLVSFLEGLPSNQANTPPHERGALVIAHSLGGLITRHAVNQRPDLFSGVVYAGTPQRCINILGPIRNGDAVMLNEKVLTAQVNFSLRTTFVLLPEDGFCFIDKRTKEEYPIDFYNPNDWARYRLSPCIEPVLPPFVSRSTTLGSLFTDSLRSRSGSHPKMDGIGRDRTLAPQLDSSSAANRGEEAARDSTVKSSNQRERNMAYLARTLAQVKRFRAETQHRSEHTAANAYPPLAVIIGKDTPTVWGARVSCREAIACADAYDDLIFRNGDGVVLAKEALLPEGYDLAKDGHVVTDRGHITLLGDMVAVAKALEAVVRGRQKGIGLGKGAGGGRKVSAGPPLGAMRTGGSVTDPKNGSLDGLHEAEPLFSTPPCQDPKLAKTTISSCS